MLKIRHNDMIQVIKGRDRGKKGKILRILPGAKRALVEGINLVKKHKRKTQADQQGGIVSIESSISLANVMILCKHCNRPARIGFKALKGETKTRFCKGCGETL